jgi:hypothetical protein
MIKDLLGHNLVFKVSLNSLNRDLKFKSSSSNNAIGVYRI